ncbi:MAG: TonB-dependent receptor [Proteiniphilum sp.]|nr:TonB-dependent receptor [Proteiniphilum sp.]
MKYSFLALSVLCNSFFLFSEEVSPLKENHPQDTVKVYYLNEVVISSSVKETNDLRNMPTAVTVTSPRQLKNNQIESLTEMSSFVPNLFIPSYGSKVSTPIYIRGIGARLGSQTVSLYVDNVPSFNPSAFDCEFQDIQRVEVLRGAQGTLYGRNAIGGIVNLYTLSPLTYQGSSVMLGGGNYGQFSVKGSSYSRVSDHCGLSVAAYYKRDDGFFRNNYTGSNVDASENAGGRMKLEWEATPSFRAQFFGNYDYVSGGAFPYMHRDSSAVNFNEPSSYDRHLFTNGLSLDFKGNGYSVHSTTGYQFLKDDMKMDQDYTPKSVFSINQKQQQHSLSQEITVKSDNRNRYRWVAGAFGFYDHRAIDTPVAIKEEGIAALEHQMNKNIPPTVPVRIEYNGDLIELPGNYTKPSRGAALFHQSTFHDLFGLSGLSVTAGLRFDHEHTGIDFYTESHGSDVNIVIPGLAPGFVEGDTLLEGNYSKSYWEILPKFALQYQFTPTAHIYLSASKGYKTGGYNEQAFSKLLQNVLSQSIKEKGMKKMSEMMRQLPGGGKPAGAAPGGTTVAAPSLEEQLSYDPERSWTYELGGRYEMLDRKLSLAYAFFYTNVRNIQIIKLLDNGAAGRVVTNAGKSDSKGFELSLKYMPLSGLSCFADYGFADARFRNYQVEGKNEKGKPVTIDYAGNHIPFAPRHTLSLGVSYVYDFAHRPLIDRLVTNMQYSGVGKIYWTESNRTTPQGGDEGVELYQPFYGLVNGSVAAEKGALSLEFWVKNLFNTDYHSFLFEASDMTTGKVNQFVQRGYPTRLGATLRYTISR